MSRIAVVCIVLCLALWGINAATVAVPTNQTPNGGETSYAVDLYRPATQSLGFLDVSPIQLGNGKSTTVEIEIYARSTTGCILSMGEPGTDNFFALQLNGGNLLVRVGAKNLPNSVAQSTGSQIQANTWTTLSVVITNNDASSATVTAYANGAVIIDHASTRALTANTRTKVLIGRCQYSAGLGDGQGPQDFNAIVDNFRVWDLARSVDDIKAFATLISTTVDLNNPTGLIVHFPFVEGVGATSVAYAGQVANNFYVASFIDAVWVVKNAGNIFRTCSSAGDPHIAVNVPGQSTVCFDPPHIVGQWQLTSCGENFQVRTYHAPVRAWNLGEGCDVSSCGPTINNAFTVRAYDDVFYISESGNYFIKKIYDTTFTAIGTGSGVRASGTRYNLVSGHIFIEVPAAGYLNADNIALGGGRYYSNIYIYHTQNCETLGVRGLCAKQDQRVTWNQFLFLDNANSLPAPGEVTPRDFDPCSTLPAALQGLVAQAEAACSLTIDKVKFPIAWEDCRFDVCASGDISVATNINDDGTCRLAEILAAQTGTTAPSCTTRAQCPNSCSGHGVCGDNGCTCQSGYVGPDCARPASFPCFSVQNGHELPLNPWVFQTSSIGTIADTDFFTFWNTWHTEDGILIYFARVEASQDTYTYNLFISNDAANADGGAYDLVISGNSAWYQTYTTQSSGVSVSGDTTTVSISFSWEPFRSNGIIFKNVDAAAAHSLAFTISGKVGIRQVSVGANSLRTELDVLAVADTFTLTTGTCVDDCASITDCEACAAVAKCGWCRSNGQCLLGNPSGPRAATCADWKFSTDDNVARRLTASFGYPVNPDANTAYLPVTAAVDLDVDLFVSMGNKETIQWDVALVLGASGLTNADDRTNWLVDLGSLTSVFSLFPNLGFSLGTYSSVTTNKFTLISALVDASKVTSDVLRSWVYGIQLAANANNDAATSALATLTNPSFGLNWRTNTRRMVAIYVDQAPVLGTDLTPTFDELRQTLLNFRVLPVFLATSNVQGDWNAVVSALGFGLVIPVQADSGDLAFAVNKAINLATSQISLITDLTSQGHVVGRFGQSVTGLSSNMRARFSVPFKANSTEALTTKLIAPGFGAATVTNVLNDSPLATIKNIKLTEDNWDNDYKFNGTVFRLAGLASNGVDPVLAQVIAEPTKGALYQFDIAGAKETNRITTASGPVFVSDSQGRVIYLAPPDASSIGDEEFAHFVYRVRDACASSTAVTVRVDVIGVNDRPWTQMAAPIGDEDTAITLTFNYFDREGDDAVAVVTALPYDVLASGATQVRGKLYQYTSAVAAGDRTNAVEVALNQPIVGNKAVYFPWANANTEKKPEVLFTQPFFTYYVQETTCCKDNSCDQNTCTKLTSWPETVQIFVRAVNDAPVIIKDSDLTNYNFTAVPCFSDCTFLEDNGARYPDLAQPVQVWLGGGDIELDQLKAVITALEMPAAAVLTDLSGNAITVGSVIGPFSAGSLKFDGADWQPVGTLFPALRFTPGLDENNNANGYYAKITYKVNDGLLDSAETKTITIRITPVNDLPRSTIVTTYTGPVPTNQPGVLAVPHVITLMNQKANFSIVGTDPEKDDVTPVLTNCRALGGLVEYLGNDNTWVKINCTLGATLATKPSGSSWLFRYTPPANTALDDLQAVTYQLKDGSNENRPSDAWTVTIDVIAINRPPTLTLDDNAAAVNLTLSSNVAAGLPLNYNLTLNDPDVASGTMTFTAILTCLEPKQENCVARIQVNDIGQGRFVQNNKTKIVVTGMIFDIQQTLNTFNFFSAKTGKYAMMVTINDNGNLGVCPLQPGSNTIVRQCPLQATLISSISVDDGDSINTIVIASVAGAAAAAGIAVAAGFASRLNKKAQSAQYTPWEINDMDRGISNPLHESPTVEMSNPLHEGPESINE